MALIKCPDCGNDVSTAALACPHCGRPVSLESSARPGTPPPISEKKPGSTPPPVPTFVASRLLLKAFVWLGARLFDSVIVYAPADAGGNVLALHFGVSQEAITASCRELAED